LTLRSPPAGCGGMPAVLHVYGLRFPFYSLEAREPPHMHVECDWLMPVERRRNVRIGG